MGSIVSTSDFVSLLLLASPGAVFIYFRSQFLTGRMPPLRDGLTAFLIISVMYHAFGVLALGDQYSSYLSSPVESKLVLISSLVLPGVFGLISGVDAKKEWSSKALGLFGIQTVHPVESAWDWHFSRCQESWVIVRLRDGGTWGGVLGSSSFISSNPDERDIFLEQVYQLDENDNWGEPKASSVWLSKTDIQSIEMWLKKDKD